VQRLRGEAEAAVRECRAQVQRYAAAVRELELLRLDESDLRETMAAIDALRAGLAPPDAQATQDLLPPPIPDSQMADLEATFPDDDALEAALEPLLAANRAARAECAKQRREVSGELRRAVDYNRALGAALEQAIRFCEAPI
jgi:hypothetical protein